LTAIFASHLVARDVTTQETLAAVGVDLDPLTSFDSLFSALARKGLTARWAKIAAYKMTEGPLALPIGDFLRNAARASGIEIVFDWCSQRRYGGITGKVIDELDLPRNAKIVLGVRYVDHRRALFHPKVLLMGVSAKTGDELRLAIVGSANITGGGLHTNTELGVVSAWWNKDRAANGWPELDDLFASLMKAAKPLKVTDLSLLAADAPELSGWTEAGVPGAVSLRPYQEEAVQALVDAWEERYARRPSATWKGTLLVLPPATGKTLCALTAACRILDAEDGRSRSGPVVWLSDRPLLAAQAFEEFRRTGFLQRYVIGALVKSGRILRSTMAGQWDIAEDGEERRPSELGRGLLHDWLASRSRATRTIVFTTKGDAKSLRTLGDVGPSLTIVDEAHHATAPGWHETLTALRSFLVVGLTGTPYRKAPETTETDELLGSFSVGANRWLSCFTPARQEHICAVTAEAEARKVAYGQPVASFYRSDFTGTELSVLSAPTFTTVSVVNEEDREPIQIRAVGGTRTQRIRFFEDPFSRTRDLDELVDDPKAVKAALESIDNDTCDRASRAQDEEKTTLVFARNITHANILHDLLLDRGVCPVVIHNEDERTVEGRHRDVQSVRDQAGSVVVCVDMVSEGLDLPSADVIIMPRWTASERLFWQMIGRGLRGPAIGGTERVDVITYELAFGADERGVVTVQVVDRLLLEAFGKHAKRSHAELPVRPTRDHTKGRRVGRTASRRRQGDMVLGEINHRASLGLEGDSFDVVIWRPSTGDEVDGRAAVLILGASSALSRAGIGVEGTDSSLRHESIRHGGGRSRERRKMPTPVRAGALTAEPARLQLCIAPNTPPS
jgi:superfamily II DNA or RNA helicase